MNDKCEKTKTKYSIYLGSEYLGDSVAVSPEKARTNYWWVNFKDEYEFTKTDIRPEDLTAVPVVERSPAYWKCKAILASMEKR